MTMNDPFSELASQAPVPRANILESLRKEVAQDPAPRRALTRAQRVALSGTALIIGLVLTSARALIGNPTEMVLAAVALSLGAGGLLLAGIVPGEPGKMGFSARRALVVLLSLVAFATLAFQADSFVPWREFLGAESMRHATMCAGHSLLSGVLAAGALMYLWRRTDPFSPGLTGALLGLLGGAVGTLSVGLLCESGEGLHLTLGHGLSLLVLGGLGILIGRKWLTP